MTPVEYFLMFTLGFVYVGVLLSLDIYLIHRKREREQWQRRYYDDWE